MWVRGGEKSIISQSPEFTEDYLYEAMEAFFFASKHMHISVII